MFFLTRSNHAASNTLKETKSLYQELTNEQAEVV